MWRFNVLVLLLNENATVPTRANLTDAGLDLYASEDAFIELGTTAVVPTGIAVEIPGPAMLKIEDRSSLASKGLRTGAGVIDSGYRGEIKVVLHNLTCSRDNDPVLFRKGFRIKKGDKIAQMVLHSIYNGYDSDVVVVDKLSETDRGTGGFGSSGR